MNHISALGSHRKCCRKWLGNTSRNGSGNGLGTALGNSLRNAFGNGLAMPQEMAQEKPSEMAWDMTQDPSYSQAIPKLNADWLAPHHQIPNSKFPPITALLNILLPFTLSPWNFPRHFPRLFQRYFPSHFQTHFPSWMD